MIVTFLKSCGTISQRPVKRKAAVAAGNAPIATGRATVVTDNASVALAIQR